MKRQRQNNKRATREQIVFLVVFIMFVLITMYVDRNSAVRDHAMSVPLNDGWTLENGEVVNLESLPLGNHTLERNVRSISGNGKALCLKSIETGRNDPEGRKTKKGTWLRKAACIQGFSHWCKKL